MKKKINRSFASQHSRRLSANKYVPKKRRLEDIDTPRTISFGEQEVLNTPSPPALSLEIPPRAYPYLHTDTLDIIEIPDWILREYCTLRGINYQIFKIKNKIMLGEYYRGQTQDSPLGR